MTDKKIIHQLSSKEAATALTIRESYVSSMTKTKEDAERRLAAIRDSHEEELRKVLQSIGERLNIPFEQLKGGELVLDYFPEFEFAVIKLPDQPPKTTPGKSDG